MRAYRGTRSVSLPMLFCALFLIIAGGPARAAGTRSMEGRGLIVQYEQSLESAASGLAASYPRIRSETETRFGWKVSFVPRVLLVRKHADFRKMAGSDLVTAFAVSPENLIVIDYSKMTSPLVLDATLKHELCHLLLHGTIKTVFLPRWLDEGIAQWASGGVADIINPGEKDILKQAAITGHFIPLWDISRDFPSRPRETLLAYEESRSFIEFVEAGYGAGKLLAVLNSMRDGLPAEQAAEEHLGSGFNSLEKAWQKKIRARYTWPVYLSDNLYWVLFAAAALVTIMGYIKLRKLMRSYRDEGPDNDQQDWREPPGDI